MRAWRVVISAAIIAFLLMSLGLALDRSTKNDLPPRFNAKALEAREFMRIPEPFEETKVNELVDDFLAFAETSDNNPIVRSASNYHAGALWLFYYNEKLRLSEGQPEFKKPPRARLESADRYLSEAARICGREENKDRCFFREIQTNLDFVRSKLGKQSKENVDSEKEQGAEASRPRRSRKDGSATASDSLEDDGEEGAKVERPLVGSVRGAHSSEPQEPANDNGFDGSGFTTRPNIP